MTEQTEGTRDEKTSTTGITWDVSGNLCVCVCACLYLRSDQISFNLFPKELGCCVKFKSQKPIFYSQ